VARWEIDARQVELAMQRARPGRGVELEVPWQAEPPTQSRLQLFLRYWRPDGTAVLADTEINITPHGQLAARWTPRTEQRPAPRRMRIADSEAAPEQPAASAEQREPPPQSPTAGDDLPATTRQAQLPQWRPYR
jgi:hypothetical protein